MMEQIIKVENLTKDFVIKKGPVFKKTKEILKAVDGVSFDIRKGEIFSLLGPNGAGKTTTIKMLSTLLIPTSGRAWVKGLDVVKDEFAVRQVLTAVLPGERTLYWKLTVRENLEYFGSLYGLKGSFVKRRIDELLGFFGLQDKRSTLVEKLSTGQRQKVVLSRALIPEPEVILLDEPTLGLDPNAAIQLRSLIRKISDAGTTILLTTHYMYEADELSDRVAIIAGGKIVCLDTPEALKKTLHAKKIVRVTLSKWDEQISREYNSRFITQDITYQRQYDDFKVTIKYDAPRVSLPEITEFFVKRGIEVRNITIDAPTLEDVFIEKTGTTMEKKEEQHDASPVLA
ncbi:MAG: ABC transporter ATP-binding protein [Spirochaetia bacterium]